MRALRSRVLQSDSEINETKTEEPEHTEQNVSKKLKRKKFKKRHSNENGQDLDIVQELVVKKKKTKKSKKQIADSSMIQENETATKVLSTSTESLKLENKDEKVARKKKSKKRTAEILDIVNETDTKVLSTSTESLKLENNDGSIATMKKSKKSKMRTAEILDSFTSEANETDTKILSTNTKSENKDKKVARKKKSEKSKKRTAEIQDSSTMQENETDTKVLSTSTDSQKLDNKDKKVARKKKFRKSKEFFAEIQDNSTIPETETASKLLSSSTESLKPENKDKNIATKKKFRRPKEFFAEIQDSSTMQENETATKVLSTSIESQKSENKEEKVARKKKISYPKEIFAEIQENETASKVLSTSTEFQKSENKVQNITAKQKIRNTRDFLRSTILNSPNFDNVITSTAVKPKRPEIKLEDSENVEMENTSLINLKKLKKEKDQKKRMSKIEDSKEFNRRETVPRNKSLSDTNDSIVQTINKTKSKQSILSNSIALNKTSNKSLKINSQDKLNESTKQIVNKRRSTAESSIDGNRDLISNRRETFCKPPKILNITDNVIAISDSPDISKPSNTFNKSNTVEPELTSDEEMETDESFKSMKLEKNKVLLVENTVITISDTPERTTVKQNSFNKLDSPEITSDEDEEIIEDKQNKSLRMNQSLNCTKTKSNFSEKNNDSFNRSNKDCKTPKNIFTKSEKITDETLDEFNELSDVGENILEDIIDISDGPDESNIKQSTFNLSDNCADTTITKSERIVNTSGDWHVEKGNTNTEDVETNLNSTFEVENKENDSQNFKHIKDSRTSIENCSNETLKNENVSLSPKDKTIRKKWLKFPRHSSDAKLVLDQISSPKLQKKMNASKIVEQFMNTPTDLFKLQKQTIAPSNLSVQKTNFSFKNSSVKKSPRKSPLKSIKKPVTSASSSKKSATKRTALPNFALIHQKAFEKMENLAEYSERKKQRAQVLLSSNNPGSKRKSSSTIKPKSEENKFSRKLFTNESSDARYNRFGFKTVDQKKPINLNVAIVKPVVKPSVFARSDVVAIANKNKVVTNKKNDRRDAMKGVRTNRRFELLMQMRNK